MACKCGSTRIISVGAKASDCQNWSYEKDGELIGDKQDYAPYIPKVAGGDYIQLEFCADCGQIQNFKPVSEEMLAEYFEIEEASIDGDDEEFS
jgi:hypothetical protein